MSKHTIPDAALNQHIAVLGKTGSGKSSTAKLCIEQVVANGARVCVLDPIKSDWWGITLASNGVDRGLPFQILGGPKGHIALHESAGKVIAEVVASGALPHSIIDMANFAPGGIAKFFVDFAPVLIQKMRGVLYLVIEEAHEFAPKERSGIGQESMAIHFAKRLAVSGRSKGIRLIVVTQRTQALHNAILGSVDTLIAHRLTAPADQDPVIKWLKANTDKKTLEKVASSLGSLKTGQGWLCSGEAQIFEKQQFPRISTYDNTATPSDEEHREVVVPAVDVDALKHLIGQAAVQAEANDPKRLKEEVAKLRTELAKRAAPPPTPQPPTQGVKSMSSSTDQKLDELISIMKQQRLAAPAPAPSAPVAHVKPSSNGTLDEEGLYQRFKQRLLSEVSLGTASITVTPPEKLRKDFQTEESARIVSAVAELNSLGKRVLKLLEGVGKALTLGDINLRLGRSIKSTSDISPVIKGMAEMGVVKAENKWVRSTLRDKIAADLSDYQPTDDEVEAVYQNVLFEIATAGEPVS